MRTIKEFPLEAGSIVNIRGVRASACYNPVDKKDESLWWVYVNPITLDLQWSRILDDDEYKLLEKKLCKISGY